MSLKKIKILPQNISNKIAAGEVVERPASVVKELMENSLDAGAENIEVFIKRAGKVLIQVVDDGEGMSEEDAEMCLQRHATSKITEAKDLEAIRTFGFRGEALSSIASVSNIEIKTERKEDELGTEIKFENDSTLVKDKGAFNKGTSVSVKNLFYNTPARRNFLKTHATELKHIMEAFKRSALGNPDVNFKLYNDNDPVFDFKKGSLENRLIEVFADNLMDVVIETKELTDYINLTGYIAKPAYLRHSKGEQYFFINKRYVTSKTINHAVYSAYENILEKGDYPFFAIYMEIDPTKIDINVHPAKLEVKFDDEKEIYSFVHAVVKKSLGSYDLVPSMTFNGEEDSKEKLRFIDFKKTGKDDFTDRPNFNSTTSKEENRPKRNYSEQDIDLLFNSLNPEIKTNAPQKEVEHPFDKAETREVYHDNDQSETGAEFETPFIFSLHNKYILAQIKSGLMIIDYHVAHERILYEKAIKSFNANMPFTQQLLFSQSMHVDPGDYAQLKELEPFLIKLGFEIKFMSKNKIVVTGVPSDVKVGNEIDILKDILEEYKKNQREKKLEVRDNLAKSFSCKAAVKAGDKLTDKEMRLLVDQLFATSMPYVCPHGRPIVVKIPLEEFDKRFGRT